MSVPPQPGSLVAWWNEGELQCAVVLGEEKRKVRLLGARGREVRAAPSRLAYQIEASGAVPGAAPPDLQAAAERAAAATRRLREQAADCDVPLIWELAREQPGVHSAKALAELAFGDGGGAARAALASALQAERIHFVRKGDGWEPRPAEIVQQLLHERERARQHEIERSAFLEALRAALGGGRFVASGSEWERRCLGALRELALEDLDASDAARALAAEVLRQSGIAYDRPHEGAFRLLRRLGHFRSDDENLHLLRHGWSADFPPEVEEHAARAAASGFAAADRTDLTALEVVTIDSPGTREVDDGLSLEPLAGGGVRLGIHIADPSVFLEPGDPVDREAQARAITHYLPEGRLLMVPPAISEHSASLLVGELRPALSFFAEIGEDGRLETEEILRSVVRAGARLSYDEADRAIREPGGERHELLERLVAGAARLERRRIEAGAVRIRSDEVDVHVEADGRIRLERHPADSPSRDAVSELMVLAGRIAARFCSERGIPAIYRRQPAPDRPIELPSSPDPDPVAAYAARRALRRGEVGLEPGPHYALGLDRYAQVTSPLRRYQDLATHRQIAAALAGRRPVYDAESLQRIAATTERAEIDSRRVERAWNRYWLLRYLEQQGPPQRVAAVVLAVQPRTVVRLEETLLEQPAPAVQGLGPGERVKLVVERVNPRADLLVLRPPA